MARIKKKSDANDLGATAHKAETNSLGDQQANFLSFLSACGSVSKSCILAGLSRRTVYNWRRDTPAFKALWDEAAELGTDALEDEANRRAFEGVDRPVFQGKELVGHVREYSDTLLIFLLKARRPLKYRDRISAELTGANGGPVKHEHNISFEEFGKLPLAERLQFLQRTLAAPSSN